MGNLGHVSSLELRVNKHHNKRGPDARGMTSRLQHHPSRHEICQRLGASFPLPATPIFSFSPQVPQTSLLSLLIGAINCKNSCAFSTCRRASRKDTVPAATLGPYPVQLRQQLLPSKFPPPPSLNSANPVSSSASHRLCPEILTACCCKSGTSGVATSTPEKTRHGIVNQPPNIASQQLSMFILST